MPAVLYSVTTRGQNGYEMEKHETQNPKLKPKTQNLSGSATF